MMATTAWIPDKEEVAVHAKDATGKHWIANVVAGAGTAEGQGHTVDEMMLARMQEIRACHHVRPTAMRLTPLDHWLALKAFPHR